MKLARYLEKYKVKPREFAILIGVKPPSVYRLLAGHRASYRTAIRIETVTRGQVTIREVIQPGYTESSEDIEARWQIWDQATSARKTLERLSHRSKAA